MYIKMIPLVEPRFEVSACNRYKSYLFHYSRIIDLFVSLPDYISTVQFLPNVPGTGRSKSRGWKSRKNAIEVAWKLRGARLASAHTRDASRRGVRRGSDIDRRTTFTKGECLSTLFSPLSAFAAVQEQRKIYGAVIESRQRVTGLLIRELLERRRNLLLFNRSNSVIERAPIFPRHANTETLDSNTP